MRLTAVLIVKNEEAIVANALESVKDFDEIVVVDTGSTDSTLEIVSKYTDKVFHFPWIDDFSAARNFGIEKATGDWIYSIDADHILTSHVETVRESVDVLEELNEKSGNVSTFDMKTGKLSHQRNVLFKNDPSVRWHGKVHESLLPEAKVGTPVQRHVGYSDNHKLDPNRNLRILLSHETKTPRHKFYIGREHYEKRLYTEAIEWMTEYLKEGKWTPEIAEAHMVISRSHWFLHEGDKARDACLQAIKVNPDFKEALLFMGNMHYDPWKEKWHKLASVATNKDVLFIRN